FHNHHYRAAPSASLPPWTDRAPEMILSTLSPPLENQFKGFRTQLEESGSLRYRIKTVVMDIESTTRSIFLSDLETLIILLACSFVEILEETKVQIGKLRELYKQLAEIVWDVPGQYYSLQ
ncbi:hypothetical protein LINPERHAP2_LOCUS232, partial [Linum perenne]